MCRLTRGIRRLMPLVKGSKTVQAASSSPTLRSRRSRVSALGVELSLTRIKKKLEDKQKKAEEAVEGGGSSPRTVARTTQVSIEQDDVQAVLEVAQSVSTAKAHWRRLRRVTKMMMLLRNTKGGRNADRLGDVARTVT